MRKLHDEGWASTSKEGNNGRIQRRKEPGRDCLLHFLFEIIDPLRVVNYMFKGRDEGSSGQVQVLIAISESSLIRASFLVHLNCFHHNLFPTSFHPKQSPRSFWRRTPS